MNQVISFTKRHRAGLAYVLLAAMSVFAIFLSTQQSEQRARDIGRAVTVERQKTTDEILTVNAIGGVQNCLADQRVLDGVRQIVVTSFESSKESLQAFVDDGTITEAGRDQSLKRTQGTTRTFLKQLAYRNCDLVIGRYVPKITNGELRESLAQELRAEIAAEKESRKANNPTLSLDR